MRRCMREIRSSSIGSRDMIDAVMDRYVTWRERSSAVELAYRDWATAAREDRELAYADYVAALDCEEFAAGEYGAVLVRAGRLAKR